LDTIQAAVLNVKLTAFMEHELEDVNRIYKFYNEKLNGVVETPVIPDGYISSFAQYTIKLKNKAERDEHQAKLKEQGIPSMVYYVKPMHKQGAFSELGCKDEDFKVTNELCETVLSLPMHPYMSEEDVDMVCDAIKSMIHLRDNV
jgi:UDP-2-acetamido-2-deoxy-ribo-hexuluronate aminotransferase